MVKKIANTAPEYGATYVKYPDTMKKFWYSEPDAEATILKAEKGFAAINEETIHDMFKAAVDRKAAKVALRVEDLLKLPPLKPGQKWHKALPISKWKSWTYLQYYEDSRKIAKAIINLGLEPHDTVCVFGFNSPEWSLAALGAMLAGGKASGIYPTDTTDTMSYKVDQSNASVLFVEREKALGMVKESADDMPYLKAVVTWATEPGEDIKRSDGSVIKTLSFEEVLVMGAGISNEQLEERISNQRPGHCAALIYTSGTTGRPKAVMLSHDNIRYEVLTILNGPLKEAKIGVGAQEERIFSYLPLSHVAGMLLDIIAPIATSAATDSWGCTYFARPYDLKKGSIGERLGVVKPTMFLGVPRVWEKIEEKLKAVGEKTKGIKKSLADMAKRQHYNMLANEQFGGTGRGHVNFISRFLIGAIKKKLGLDQCKVAVSGAAPLKRETQEYFGSLGINVNENYGLSECSVACTWSTDKYHVWGTVGFELPSCEVKVFHIDKDGQKSECPRAKDIFSPTEEEQGELCIRGRNVMMGYLANPRLGQEHVDKINGKNADNIDDEGWLHTGDKASIDENGLIKITGRYKELIIGAGGENIAPVPIEDDIKEQLPAVSNVMMIGDKRKFNICFITLKVLGATGELAGTDELIGPAKRVSDDSKTVGEAMNDDKWIEYIRKGIKATNENQKVVVSNAAKIQKFMILPRDFSVEYGELTPTQKLKRGFVEKMYAHAIDDLYNSSDDYVLYDESKHKTVDTTNQ